MDDPKKTFTLTAADFARLNPNTKTCPIFRSKHDAELTTKIYKYSPVLVNESLANGNPWGIEISRMLNASDDSPLFLPYDKQDNNLLRIYESKYFWQFDHRYATDEDGESVEAEVKNKIRSAYVIQTRFCLHKSKIPKKFIEKINSWFLSYRVISNATNERTIVSSILPKCGLINSANNVYGVNGLGACCLIANYNSFTTDYVCRQAMGGTNLHRYVFQQLAVLPPDRYTPELLATIVPRVLELTYTAWDLRAFADDVWAEASDERGTRNDESKNSSLTVHPSSLQNAILQQWQANRDATGGGHEGAVPPAWAARNDERGMTLAPARSAGVNNESKDSSLIVHHSSFPHPPFKWDGARRAQLRADLDGLYGHLYGLTREELAYILDTFPIVRRKDEARYGEYRTKRMVLEAYDKLQG